MTSFRSRRLASASACALLAAATFAAPALAQTIDTIGSDGVLRTIAGAAPGTVLRQATLSGLQAGEGLLGIDYRPTNGTPGSGLSFGNQVFGTAVGSQGGVYQINRNTGVATLVGTLTHAGTGAAIIPAGTSFGVDWNPTNGLLRVNSDADQNLRIAVPGLGSTGTAATTIDGTLTGPGGTNPSVTAAAYGNNVNGAGTTTLFVIDSASNRLLQQNPANAGTLVDVGALGVDAGSLVAFDIQSLGGTDTGYAVFQDAATGATNLYQVNLATGAATAIGPVGAGTTGIAGLSISNAPAQINSGNAVERTVARSLYGYSGAATGDQFARFLAAASAVELGQGAALSGEVYTSLGNLPIRQSRAVIDTLRDRVQLEPTGDGATRGVWVAPYFGFGSEDGEGGYAESEYDFKGFLIGYDQEVSPGFVLGLAAGVSEGDNEIDTHASKVNLTSYELAAFAGYRLNQFVFDASIGYSFDDYEARRFVAGGRSGADFDGERLTAAARIAYALGAEIGGFAITPEAGIQYVDVKIDSFTENGPAALAVGGLGTESLTTKLGATLTRRIDAALFGSAIVPRLGGFWIHEFEGDRNVSTSFSDLGTTGMRFNRETANEDAGLVQAGIDVLLDNRGTFFTAYEGEFGDRLDAHQVRVGYRIRF